MAQTDFIDNVVITGSRDIDQLKVKANVAQTKPLQSWKDSGSDTNLPLAQITSDGRLQVGDDVGLTSPDALIEAHRHENSTTKPNRGLHSLGRVGGTLNAVVQWIVAELELRGSSVISAVHSALRVKASNLNTGTPTAGAELRAGDFEVSNDAAASGAALPKALGIQVSVTNALGKTITDAIGLKVKMNNSGTITNPFSIYTEGPGPMHLEDYMEVKRPAAVPGTPSTDFMRVYPKSDARLYGKNSSGIEVPLSNSAVLLYDNTLAADGNWDVDLSTLPDGLNYLHLELIVLARSNVAGIVQWINMLFNNDAVLTNYKASMIYNNFAIGSAAILVSPNPYATPIPGATAPANSFGISRIFIPFYRLTTALHSNHFNNSYKIDTNDGLITMIGTHHWLNTAAINRIQIKADNDPTNKIVTNSRLQIIGYRF